MTNICNFCLKLSSICSSVDETLKEAIELVFINVELVIADCSQICKECIQRVHSAFDLKTASIRHENLIVSYDSNKPNEEKLIEVYLEKHKIKCDIFPKCLKVCRICISVVAENDFYLLKDIEVDSILGETITTHFCEIDFSITNNPIVCKDCLKKLQAYGMFIKSWLDIYNIKKNYCHINQKIDDVRQIIFENNIDRQHSDTPDIDKTNIKTETFTKVELENGNDQNEENRDNIPVNDDIEIDEWKYPVEGLQIKIEPVSYDSQLKNDVSPRTDDFEIEVLKDETEALHFEAKLESDDFTLKEEEISINDATYNDDSTQKSNESSSSKPEAVPTEVSTISTSSSRFFTESPPKIKEKDLNSKKSIKQLWAFKNSQYQRIEINDGFRCGLSPFNQLEASVKEHFKNYHYSKYNHLNRSEDVDKKNSDKIYEFEHCNYKTQFKGSRKSHLMVNSNELIIQKCGLCDFKTKYKNSLKLHSMLHSKQSKIYECEHCDYKSKYKGNLKSHLMVHSNQSKIHECAHCDYKTKHMRLLNRHLRRHSSETKIFSCEYCDFKSKYKSSLKSHSMMTCNQSKIYECKHCEFKSEYKAFLKLHLMVHSNQSRIYKCDHCDYKTVTNNYLKSHSMVHSSDKIHKCEHCDFKTKYKRALKSHLIVHSTESKIHKCQHCDFQTKYKGSLKSHSLVHSSHSETFECAHCEYKTKHKINLTRHLRRHSSEPAIFKCAIPISKLNTKVA